MVYVLVQCGYAILTNRLISSQVHPVTEPVAATGSDISGGFTLFQVLFPSLSLFNIIFDPWNLYQHDLPANATPSHWWCLWAMALAFTSTYKGEWDII
jgi:hypothetical protein